eukprot:5173925-Pleurochrysis_carterae.AAC.1
MGFGLDCALPQNFSTMFGNRQNNGFKNAQRWRVIPQDGGGGNLNETAALPYVHRTMEAKFGVKLMGLGVSLFVEGDERLTYGRRLSRASARCEWAVVDEFKVLVLTETVDLELHPNCAYPDAKVARSKSVAVRAVTKMSDKNYPLSCGLLALAGKEPDSWEMAAAERLEVGRPRIAGVNMWQPEPPQGSGELIDRSIFLVVRSNLGT